MIEIELELDRDGDGDGDGDRDRGRHRDLRIQTQHMKANHQRRVEKNEADADKLALGTPPFGSCFVIQVITS